MSFYFYQLLRPANIRLNQKMISASKKVANFRFIRPYIEETNFTVILMDYFSLLPLDRLSRWTVQLQVDIPILHYPANNHNVIPDALSHTMLRIESFDEPDVLIHCIWHTAYSIWYMVCRYMVLIWYMVHILYILYSIWYMVYYEKLEVGCQGIITSLSLRTIKTLSPVNIHQEYLKLIIGYYTK